ncbi:uncharacterized protein LOC142985836 [Anticarsia gemmatalis]|uniref:uncharacterized protein LOC142985836 n=1 Tax=Anticarsia gemmatalis TaxID=129554 RepID=UPI003F76F88A
MNVTLRTKCNQPEVNSEALLAIIHDDIKNILKEWKATFDASLEKVNDNINSLRRDLESCIKEVRKEVADLRSENIDIKTQVSKLTEEVAEIKTSAQYISDQYEDFSARLKYLEERFVDERAIKTLELKIDNLEQQARQCNLELSNIPEKRGENLVTLLEDIGKKIDFAISRDDIISIHRVPHVAGTANERPKNIIAKMKTRSLRDNIISAYRLKKGLTSTQLGIAGAPHIVYINEHLTLRRKQLYREARAAARERNHKFVWVKNATILVKRAETSRTIPIITSDDIVKIKVNN